MTTAGCGVIEDNGHFVSVIPKLDGKWIEFRDAEGRLERRMPQDATVAHRHYCKAQAVFWIAAWMVRN